MRSLTAVDKSVAPAIVAGLVALFSVLFAFWKDRSAARQEAHREKKVEVYSEFFDIVFMMVRKSKDDGELSSYADSKELQESLMNIMRGVMFYGSPRVIRAFSAWRVDAAKPTSDPYSAMKKIGDVLLAMRRDIGLSNFGLDNLTIHQLYVNDDMTKLQASR